MADKLQALDKTYTWDLFNLPHGKFDAGCKRVCKNKTKAVGTVERYKAWLVAKDFIREYEIDHDETFASVACLASIQSFLL